MRPEYTRPDGPLHGPGVWRGEALRGSDAWIRVWSRDEVVELEAAMRAARALRRPLETIGPEDFPLPTLARTLEQLRDELLFGRGFVLLRGLEPERYGREEIALLFWGIGAHLGRALPQNGEGHLLGHVTDLGMDARDPAVRIYQTGERQGYHTDSADLVGLLCLQPARAGGRSALVSAATLHDVLLERAPELLAELFLPFCTDHRGEFPEGGSPYFTAPILSWYAGELSVLYQRRYIESAQRFLSVPRLTERQIAALDALDAAADDPSIHLEMELSRGDIQWIHNHALLHDRTAFEDWPEPERRRHLLRLWTCPSVGRALPPWFAERLSSVEVGRRGGVALRGVEATAPFYPARPKR